MSLSPFSFYFTFALYCAVFCCKSDSSYPVRIFLFFFGGNWEGRGKGGCDFVLKREV